MNAPVPVPAVYCVERLDLEAADGVLEEEGAGAEVLFPSESMPSLHVISKGERMGEGGEKEKPHGIRYDPALLALEECLPVWAGGRERAVDRAGIKL